MAQLSGSIRVDATTALAACFATGPTAERAMRRMALNATKFKRARAHSYRPACTTPDPRQQHHPGLDTAGRGRRCGPAAHAARLPQAHMPLRPSHMCEHTSSSSSSVVRRPLLTTFAGPSGSHTAHRQGAWRSTAAVRPPARLALLLWLPACVCDCLEAAAAARLRRQSAVGPWRAHHSSGILPPAAGSASSPIPSL